MLLLDTGATLTTFNKEWLEKEFKPGKDIEFVNNANGFGFSASDKMEMVILHLKTFSIGKIKLKKITTCQTPLRLKMEFGTAANLFGPLRSVQECLLRVIFG